MSRRRVGKNAPIFVHATLDLRMLRCSSIISMWSSKGSQQPVGKPPANRKLSRAVRTPGSGSSTCAIPTERLSSSCSSRKEIHPQIPPIDTDFKDKSLLVVDSFESAKSAMQVVDEELDNWATLGVDAHHATGTPWYSYHEAVREPTARLLGAKPIEVICMNSLTVNLHMMMATFYRPTTSRFKIMMEEPAFPSDTYAIKTQIGHHGLDPKDTLILARPRKGEFTITTLDIV